MTVSTGAPHHIALAYLGPRLQAVYDMVTAAHLKSIQKLWPGAHAAMKHQGVEELESFAPPAKKAGIDRFKKSITARSRPAFTRSIEEINKMPPEFMSTVIFTERIDLEAFGAFIEAGLITAKTGEAFIKSAYTCLSEQSFEEEPLLSDLGIMQAFLVDLAETWKPAKDEVSRVIMAYVPTGLNQHIIEDIGNMMDADTARAVDTAIVKRAELTYYMTPRVERRIFADTLRGRTYTPAEIEQIYAGGFISPRLYRLLKSLAVKK